MINKNKISVIVPFFNEEKTLNEAIKALLKEGFADEIILVNDGSTDNSYKTANNLISKNKTIKLVNLKKNSGKGNAIKEGLKNCKYPFIGIYDADLEYNANDLKNMFSILVKEKFDFILGSRFLGIAERKNLYIRTYLANRFLSILFSIVFQKKITDIATCYKLFKKELIEKINLNEVDFSIEVEILAKLINLSKNYIEVPISYKARSYEEGKKIKFKDGFKYIVAIFKYRIL